MKKYEVNDSDRTNQFWERNPLSIEIYSREVAEQKLRYFHNNPLSRKMELYDCSLRTPAMAESINIPQKNFIIPTMTK